MAVEKLRQLTALRWRQLPFSNGQQQGTRGYDDIGNSGDWRKLKIDRAILASRCNSVEAQSQGRHVAALRHFDRLAGQAFGLPFKQGLDRERGLVTRTLGSAGIARLKPAAIA